MARSQAGAVAFESDIWLVALDGVPASAELRAFWNVKENRVLDDVADGDRLWLGVARAVTPEEPRSPGRAGRVFDLLSLAGTLPDYAAPEITDDLIVRVVEAFDAAGEDNDLPAATREAVVDFLSARRGKFLLPDDQAVDA